VSEIFPDKFTPVERTVVGEAAAILERFHGRVISVGQLYSSHRRSYEGTTYDGFVSALTFLYAANLIDYDNPMVSFT
jgi:hypothetical protein